MAIQLPDVGTGVPADKTGDSPWLAMKKMRENFNDQTNAASRLMGNSRGRVVAYENITSASIEQVTSGLSRLGISDISDAPTGSRVLIIVSEGGAGAAGLLIPGKSAASQWIVTTEPGDTGSIHKRQVAKSNPYNLPDLTASRVYFNSSQTWSNWVFYYHTGNTTKDGNGFLKAASPIVKVFADKVELNEDATNQDVIYKKNGVGDYTITTVSGLSTDGWYIELPKDMNGNPKVAVTLEETNGVIGLKTYKRMFSIETSNFEPDLDSPLDIPDGRWIDLRLNEIPVEMPDDMKTEV